VDGTKSRLARSALLLCTLTLGARIAGSGERPISRLFILGRYAGTDAPPPISSYRRPPMILDLARLLFFPALMAFAAASDLFTMTISNRLSLALAAGFLLLAVAGGMAPYDILAHCGAGALVLVVSFTCFAMGWVGGGDAKMAAAAALWFGFDHLLNYLVYASLFGGALTVLLLQFRQWPLPYALAGQAWLSRLHDKQTGIPYGIALAIGALTVYPDTEWVKAIDAARFALH